MQHGTPLSIDAATPSRPRGFGGSQYLHQPGGLDVVSPMNASMYSYDRHTASAASPGGYSQWGSASRGGREELAAEDLAAELRVRMQKQDEELVNLRASLSDAAAYASAQYSRVIELETERQALMSSLKAAGADKESLLEHLKELLHKVAELEGKLEKGSSSSTAPPPEASPAPPSAVPAEEQQRKQEELTALYQRVKDLEAELQASRSEAAAATKRVSLLEEAKQKAAPAADTVSLEAHKAEIEHVQARHNRAVEALKQEISNLELQNSSLIAAREKQASLEVEVEWYKNRLSSTEKALQEEQQHHRDTRAALQDREARLVQSQEEAKARGARTEAAPAPAAAPQRSAKDQREIDRLQGRVIELEDERDELKTEVKRLEMEMLTTPAPAPSPPAPPPSSAAAVPPAPPVQRETASVARRPPPPPPPTALPNGSAPSAGATARGAPTALSARSKWAPTLKALGGLKESFASLRREVEGAWLGFRTDMEEPVFSCVRDVSEDTINAILGSESSAAENYKNRKPWVEQAPIDVVHSTLDGRVRLSKQAARQLTEVFAASAASRMDALLYRQEVLQREMSQDFSQQEGELSLLIQQVANFQGKKATHRQLRG